jgi:hypothetical protein
MLPIISIIAVAGLVGYLASIVLVQSGRDGLGIASNLLPGLIGIYGYTMMVFVVWGVANDDPYTTREALGATLPCYLPVLGYFLCYTLAVAGGVLLLLVPGVILMITLVLGNYLIVLDGDGVFDALRKSHALVWGNWWRSSIIITIAGMLFTGVYLVIGILAGAVGTILGAEMIDLIRLTTMMSVLLGPLVQPLLICVGLALMHDLRMRREGEDLEDAIDNL